MLWAVLTQDERTHLESQGRLEGCCHSSAVREPQQEWWPLHSTIRSQNQHWDQVVARDGQRLFLLETRNRVSNKFMCFIDSCSAEGSMRDESNCYLEVSRPLDQCKMDKQLRRNRDYPGGINNLE